MSVIMGTASCAGRHLGLVAAVVAALALPAAAEERIAQLSKATGEVSITRAADGSVDRLRQEGAGVPGGSVFAGDVVATSGAASATMVFNDGTRVDLAESTSLAVRMIDLSDRVAAGERDKPIGRRIKILAGDVYSEIVDSPGIATEFETPAGVAVVKGTKVSISVGAGGGR